MSANMDKGMVLAMSAWYDAEVYDGAGANTRQLCCVSHLS